VGPDKFVPMRDESGTDSSQTAGEDNPPETLEEVRYRARQRLIGICGVYPACDGSPDRLCQREAYGGPIKLGGAGSGSSFAANYNALNRLRLKMLALGADAMLAGRDVVRAAIGGGARGVQMQMSLFESKLKQAMLMTGCPDLESVNGRVLV
jgi:hypothetical protein